MPCEILVRDNWENHYSVDTINWKKSDTEIKNEIIQLNSQKNEIGGIITCHDSCEQTYNRDCRRCGRLPGGVGQVLCYAAAFAKYMTCLGY
jgi:hypothetical protein